MDLPQNKPLFVFDFDDTLCQSDPSEVRIHHINGTKTHLPGHLWSIYEPMPGDEFDFTDFETLKNPEPILPVWNKYLNNLSTHGNEAVWICTARKVPDPLEKWLESHGISNPQIACMSIPSGQNNGLYKAKFVSEQILLNNHTHVEFYDDREDCVEEVMSLKTIHPTVRFTVGRIKGWRIVYGLK